MENKDPIEEAQRYVANAEEIIQKANYDPELKSYTDSKYIKAAGDYLWKVVSSPSTQCFTCAREKAGLQ